VQETRNHNNMFLQLPLVKLKASNSLLQDL